MKARIPFCLISLIFVHYTKTWTIKHQKHWFEIKTLLFVTDCLRWLFNKRWHPASILPYQKYFINLQRNIFKLQKRWSEDNPYQTKNYCCDNAPHFMFDNEPRILRQKGKVYRLNRQISSFLTIYLLKSYHFLSDVTYLRNKIRNKVDETFFIA